MKITEKQLNSIISESIKRYIDNKLLRESIDHAVSQVLKESIFDDFASNPDESFMSEKSKKHKEEKHNKSNKPNGNKNLGKKRQRVIDYLKQDKVDIAQFAYDLWPDKDEDSARSYFYKCLDGKLNDSGEHYRFSDEEVNRLYSMISDNE